MRGLRRRYALASSPLALSAPLALPRAPLGGKTLNMITKTYTIDYHRSGCIVSIAPHTVLVAFPVTKDNTLSSKVGTVPNTLAVASVTACSTSQASNAVISSSILAICPHKPFGHSESPSFNAGTLPGGCVST